MKIFLLCLLAIRLFSCSIFDTTAKNGDILVARNFDWNQKGGTVNIFGATNDAYARMTISQISPTMPFEGINQKGLYIAMSALQGGENGFSLKPTVTSLEMIDLVLQKSATIEEALEVFDRYFVVFGVFLGYPPVHYKIVDASGRSVIVEIENGVHVVRDPQICRVMTNHYLYKTDPHAPLDSLKRQSILTAQRTNVDDIATAFDTLELVKKPYTVYASVYNLQTQTLYVRYQGTMRRFVLRDEIYTTRSPKRYDLENLHAPSRPIRLSKSAFLIRPHIGTDITGYHIGAKVLATASRTKRYGIEVTHFMNDTRSFTAAGIVLEQVVAQWFHMSIGTIGYFNYDKNRDDYVGLTTALGWEPANRIPFLPLIALRSDFLVINGRIKSRYSLTIGYGFQF